MLDSLGLVIDELQLCILSHEQSMEPTEAKALQRLTLDSEWDQGAHEHEADTNAVLHVTEYDPFAYLEGLHYALE